MYTLISLLILLFSYLMFKKVSGSLRFTELNMISWIFFYNLLLQSFVASILVVNDLDQHYMISKIHDPNTRIYGWLAVQYTMFTMPMGMLVAVFINGYKHNRDIFQRYLQAELVPFLSDRDSFLRYPLYFLSVMSLISVLYVMSKLDTIPFLGILQGMDSTSLAVLRQDVSRGFAGNIYVKNILALLLTPILSYIAFSYYWATKRPRDLVWFILLFFGSIIILTYNIGKAPLVEYFLGFMFLLVLIKGGIKKQTLVLIGSCLVGGLVLLYVFVGGVTDPAALFSYNSGISGRILLSQSAGTYLSFDLFPETVAHIGFASVSEFISSIAGWDHYERSARILMETFRPLQVEEGTAGVMNSLFIAEAWANHNLFGVLVAPFYVGFIIQLLFMFFLRMPKTPLFLGPFAYFSYKSSVTGGFNDYFYNAGNFILFIVFSTIICIGVLLRFSHCSNTVTCQQQSSPSTS